LIGLLQRVSEARVLVDDAPIGEIAQGLLVLVGVQPHDTPTEVDKLLRRILGYRVFPDAAGRMNVSLRGHGGGLLLVPQFTLAADTRSGMRPGFSTAAQPALGRALFEQLVVRARAEFQPVACGCFGAAMRVELINDGPVTFWLQV
jgi:D-tyrosyl-tRNA(Tyr) deacylase